MDNFRSTIATKILSSIPPRVKPIDYLMEALNISRESVYRRIRGDISFTFEEIAKLSVELKFSIDELINKDTPSRIIFDLHVNGANDPSDVFITRFNQCFQCINNLPSNKEIESVMVLNHIPANFIIFFNHLFKFTYYRWMHQNQESSLKYFYANVTLPDELIEMQKKAIGSSKSFQNNILIFDPNIFPNLIREIQYYYKRKLITTNDFLLIREDLLGLVDMMESIAQTGYNAAEAKYNFYLSSLNIEASSQYIKCEEQVKSLFFVNVIEPVAVNNPTLCAIHKKWLDSIRKYATLITQSNEILQVRYFNKQRAFIEELTEATTSVISI